MCLDEMSWSAFCCCDRNYNPKQPREERIYLAFIFLSQEKVRAGTQGGTRRQERKQATEDRFLACLAFLLIQPRTTCPEVVWPIDAWALPNQPSITKRSHRFASRLI